MWEVADRWCGEEGAGKEAGLESPWPCGGEVKAVLGQTSGSPENEA